MKGIYTKPLLNVELFTLTQTVAQDCGDSIPQDQLNFNDPARCSWDIGGGEYIFIEKPTCTINGEEMGFGCYNNPSEGNYIFRS